MRRLAFTMIELIFVIVIIGILSRFGVEFLAQAYNNFIYSSVNNTLQAQSESALETIAARLQYRIKDSTIARVPGVGFQGLSGNNNVAATVLEWVGSDIDGFRGVNQPLWSGIIDMDLSNAAVLNSPLTDTATLDNQIQRLSHNSGTDIDNTALYFKGSDSDIQTGYGWAGAALTNHNNSTMHRVEDGGLNDEFQSSIAGVNFAGTDVSEYYKLAWTAYAVVLLDGNLTLHYDYQPWEGEAYDANTSKSNLIMENVDTFQFTAVGSIVKIQVCVESTIIDGNAAGGYSLCKEKTIY